MNRRSKANLRVFSCTDPFQRRAYNLSAEGPGISNHGASCLLAYACKMASTYCIATTPSADCDDNLVDAITAPRFRLNSLSVDSARTLRSLGTHTCNNESRLRLPCERAAGPGLLDNTLQYFCIIMRSFLGFGLRVPALSGSSLWWL